VIEKKTQGKSLLPRVVENANELIRAYKIFSASIRDGHTLPPAAEWLIDNFHIIEDQIREIQEDLPEKFYLELPKMSIGELAYYPRIYAMALSVVSHTDSRIDCDVLKKFVSEFQKVAPLTIGEIWAITIVLRIALVENLRRVISQVLFTHEISECSNEIADRILARVGKSDENLIEQDGQQVNHYLGRSEVADTTLVVHLLRRLRDQHISVYPICENLDNYLSGKQKTLEQVLHSEHQFQASAQVTVGNIITSMRLISNIDWDEFFESVNLIDPILALDPAKAYSKMDFASRDRYRHVIERIAKHTETPEQEVASACVKLAEESVIAESFDSAKSHVGYFLIDKGVKELEKQFQYQQRLHEFLLRFIMEHATGCYFTALAMLMTAAYAPLVIYLNYLQCTVGQWLLVWASSVIPIMDSCLALLNLAVTRFIPPRILSKIDLTRGIPDDAKTFVVIPTLFPSTTSVAKMVDFLETRYLSNTEDNLYFAILSDFCDSDSPKKENDQELLDFAQEKIDELNERYPGTDPQEKKFYLFHRERRWNDSEKKWIGWERKRGKLQEFNRFLRGDQDTSFIVAPVYTSLFSKIHYVITLDSDTHLPRGSAKKLIGTILHPLNQPQLNFEKNQVVRGYGILQPRISITPESSGRSFFSRIFSGNTGIDPYTKAVSDVYQDLFAEGSFTGKGLYVVDAFESAMANRVPENTLLSHDLLEGLFCRTALVTDIEFLDDYPTHYEAFSKRQHRWTRGDWQLLPWILQKQLLMISHWKMIDNLRRSLMAPLTLMWLVLGWTVLPGSPAVWTISVFIFMALPPYAHATNTLLFHPGDIPWTSHFWNILGDIKTNTLQIFFLLICLVHQAYIQMDAIIRTLYRLVISKKNLLQWVSAAEVEAKISGRKHFSKSILIPVWSICGVIFVIIAIASFQAPWSSMLFLISWLAFPWIAERVSQSRTEEKYRPDHAESETLRKIARKTWNFYESFVSELDNWLIPDNYQEEPKPIVAHRTSPTNMGLLLLATCSAHDFGYLTGGRLAERLERALDSMKKLEQFNGHFYNWYDTKTLEPLNPKYISTVDSGNLAGHLLAVKQMCMDLAEHNSFSSQWTQGLYDTLLVVKEKLLATEKMLTKNQYNDIQQKIKTIFLLIDAKADVEHIHKEFQIVCHLVPQFEFITDFEVNQLTAWTQKFNEMSEDMVRFQKEMSSDFQMNALRNRFKNIAKTVDDIFTRMDFSFLYDQQRKVFTIGYNVTDGRLDNAFYDLLASESRLASFIAISKGNVPQNHWFHLGRQMTMLFQKRTLVSWSASMFEYLMPLLVMRNYTESLLHETHLSVIHQQQVYGRKFGIPWGISESGYNARDLQMNYQYGPFGIPGLGLKRGLRDDLVISPYSTFLALQVSAKDAVKNIQELIKSHLLTDLGFYEAIDYTENRRPPNQNHSVIKSFMAHHQGMIFVALSNFLHDNLMPARFHSDELIRGSDLLLQERVPRKVAMSQLRAEELHSDQFFLNKTKTALRVISQVQTYVPVTQLLSNGKYAVMLTAAGAGYSRHRGMAVSRWNEDATRDCFGTFFIIHDLESGSTWSATKQPFQGDARNHSAMFSEHKAEFRCQNDHCGTLVEVVVSSEDQVEVRRLTISNFTDQLRVIDVTSYLEPVLNSPEADIAHTTFSNLFIETEFIPSKEALLAHRRKRSATDSDKWGFHLVTTDLSVEEPAGNIQYETSRSQFIGRGRDITYPEVILKKQKLSNSSGFVLDPCLSLRKRISIPPNSSVKISFATGVADSREETLILLDKYHNPHAFIREEEMAWTREQMDLRHLNIEPSESEIFQIICGALIYSHKLARASSDVLQSNRQSQSSLWSYGISGDNPIMMVGISRARDMVLIKQLLRFQSRMRMKGFVIDLVLISEESESYRLDLYEEIAHQIRASGESGWLNKNGGVFLLRKDLIPEPDWILLQSAARVYFESSQRSLKEESQRLKSNQRAEPLVKNRMVELRKWTPHSLEIPEMKFFNGVGGFSTDGKQYVIHLTQKSQTPLPWINVIANEKEFGFLISELGSPYTWSANSRENRLTPWNNDPICDSPGEVIYIQDSKTGQMWSPTPALRAETGEYLVRHGQGYSSFEHISHEIESLVTFFVPREDEVKITKIILKNRSIFTRSLDITSYTEWVLGLHRSKTSPMVITKKSHRSNLFLALNPFSIEFSDRVAFVASSETITSFTCDRKSFLGRHGHYRDPAGLRSESLGGEIGAGWDPCVAMKLSVTLAPGETKEIIFLLGQVVGESSVDAVVDRYLKPAVVALELQKVEDFWHQSLSQLTVKTPFPEMDMLANHWLLYQTLACRVWARSAFYQSGGAIGFRDQLQDAMALVYIDPKLAREQICRAAAHQFIEGDVLHWWHPPKSKGVRTHFSDDLLWLPYVTCFYIQATGDKSVLDEVIPFLQADSIPPGKEDIYIEPQISSDTAKLFEHCIRAVDRSLQNGQHGLPLMGSGDWNDGMNRVGHAGKGESVWMAWFLGSVIEKILPHCEADGDQVRIQKYKKHLLDLQNSIEDQGWDGQWYKRAFYDDGTPLGSQQNSECKIDSLVQSWAAITKLGRRDRAHMAMSAVDEYLVNQKEKLIRLFAPAFDKTPQDPGYIKGYLPGVRENGGQYTHAAIWVAIAHASIGQGDKAITLLNMLNPINHTKDFDAVQKYKTEPYVIAADVYAVAPYMGRGGWSWYTGSSGWYYRAFIESILGFQLRGSSILFTPCRSDLLAEFEIRYQYKKSIYKIIFKNKAKNSTDTAKLQVSVDGVMQLGNEIQLNDDGNEHQVSLDLIVDSSFV